MVSFAIAVKGFIVNSKGDILSIKRRPNDVHTPDEWEIPGGRLNNPEEDPFYGLKREIQEEVGLEVEIVHPLMVNHFVRDDGQKITMIIFLCKALSENVKLSDEHTEFVWVSPEKSRDKIVYHFHKCIDRYEKYFLGKI